MPFSLFYHKPILGFRYYPWLVCLLCLLDLYIYNHSQQRNPDDGDSEYVAVNDTHDNGNIEQINYIELDYYNSTDRAWFDEVHELGEWGVVVDHERTGSNEYTVKIEVIYWE